MFSVRDYTTIKDDFGRVGRACSSATIKRGLVSSSSRSSLDGVVNKLPLHKVNRGKNDEQDEAEDDSSLDQCLTM